MNSLKNPAITAVLARLHDEAARDSTRPRDGDAQSLTRRGNIYMAVSPEEGRLLYLLARGSGAQRIVEFGASFGVSTTYLAAAARDNGGRLITTEAHPGKCAATRATLAEAGLADIATVLEGDARETLADTEPGIEFLFLDGWKGMYLSILELLEPKLADGALIVADNIDHEGARPYADHVRTNEAFVSHSLRKMEISCFAPD